MRDSLRRAKHIGLVLLVVAFLVVAFQNRETVETRLLFATIAMPRAALLTGTFVLGGLVGALLMARRRSREDAGK